MNGCGGGGNIDPPTAVGKYNFTVTATTGTAYVIAPVIPASQPSTAPKQLKIDVIAP